MVRVKNFLSIFAKNGQSNLVLVLVLVLESKGPYYVTRKQKLCYARYEKPLKNHPLEVAKKNAETYSSSNAAAHDPEERVQLHKPRQYTIYNIQYTNAKEKEKTSEEDDWLT